MHRILFIGPRHASTTGGREQLAQLHREVLATLCGNRFDTILLERAPLYGVAAAAATLSGRVDGVTRAAEAKIFDLISAREISHVWLDGSNLGVLAKGIKRRFPEVTVFSFFHNIEPRFYLGALRQKLRLRNAALLVATFIAERKAARFSDRLVVLNQRDSDALQRWHNRIATDVLPMAIEDGLPAAMQDEPAVAASRRYLLFVGGSFYANKAGIAWYAREVAPNIAIDTLVVGNGMESERAALEQHPRIKVIGRVEDLAPYYRDALAVVAPILDGSGMKTKVAEAWMHGKTVIGTSEAFTGYEQVAPAKPSNDAAAFIAAIEKLVDEPLPPFDPALRHCYDENFSRAALTRSLKRMIASLPPPVYPAVSLATQSPPSP
jgi:glycosyltransferase involved in cell wall biosynthesis